MIKASGGAAYVGGHSIASEMAQIRKSLGVCPQFDILWPSITVREHLEIFAALKGFSASLRGAAAEAAAAGVGACVHMPAHDGMSARVCMGSRECCRLSRVVPLVRGVTS